MPRESLASLTTTPVVDVARLRLLPRSELSPDVQRAFSAIVGSAAPDHFREPDRLMVEQLAQALVIQRQAAEALAEQGLLVDGKPNPLIRVVREQARLVASLLTKLRLTVQARVSKDRAATTTAIDPIARVDFRRLERKDA